MSDQILRVGTLGCGDFAEHKFLPAIVRHPRFKLSAVASRSADKANAFSARFQCAGESSYEALIARDDIDAVYVCLPPSLHAEWTMRSVLAGKHVLCEKPFATSVPQTLECQSAARTADRFAMEHYIFIHHPQHAEVVRRIQTGEIGEVRHLTAAFSFPALSANNIRYQKELGGGALLDAGGYPLYAALYFLGELTTLGANLVLEQEVDVRGGALLRSKSGQSALIAFGFGTAYECYYEIVGTTGRIKVDRAYSLPGDLSPLVSVERERKLAAMELPACDAMELSLNYFYDGVRGRIDRESHYHTTRLLSELRAELVRMAK